MQHRDCGHYFSAALSDESSCNVQDEACAPGVTAQRREITLTFSREKEEEITHSGEMDQINNFLHSQQ